MQVRPMHERNAGRTGLYSLADMLAKLLWTYEKS